MACHVSNLLDMFIKFGPKTLCSILFQMHLVELNSDLARIRYVCFTKNIYLRLVLGLAKNFNFHSLYLEKYKKLESKIFTIDTSLCLPVTLKISRSNFF
jgi:hypothetical protein